MKKYFVNALAGIFVAFIALSALAEDCATYAKRRVEVLTSQGYLMLHEGQEQTKEGTMVYALFGNAKAEILLLDAIVETQAMVKLAEQEGMKQTGQCTHRGVKFFTITGTQKAKMIKPKKSAEPI